MKVKVVLEAWQLAVCAVLIVGYMTMLYSLINADQDTRMSMSNGNVVGVPLARGGVSQSLPEPAETRVITKIVEANVPDPASEAKLHDALARVSELDGQLKEAHKVIKQFAEEPVINTYTSGVVILGMHRSGTSMLGGLMSKMGLKTGGPLIRPANDNEKGFFERMDVVLQNDNIMKLQKIDYANGVWKYNHTKAIGHIHEHWEKPRDKFFNEGRRALKFLQNPNNFPYMLKDPRLCFMLRTWLPFMAHRPAVVFQYRHPLDVAQSLLKRYEHFKIARTLRMWYVYNRRAVSETHDLCRVVTSQKAVLANPKRELDNIHHQLGRCGLQVPRKVTISDVREFVDASLAHGKVSGGDKACSQSVVDVRPPDGVWPTREPEHIKLYQECMRVYCAMEDRSIFTNTFQWDMAVKD